MLKNVSGLKSSARVVAISLFASLAAGGAMAQANDTLAKVKASGELAKLYDKWFIQPIPPKNTRVGLPASEFTKAAWVNLNDKPMEELLKK